MQTDYVNNCKTVVKGYQVISEKVQFSLWYIFSCTLYIQP